jgi:ankyrin repeat protein
MEENEEGIESNRQILRLLVKGKGKDGIDEGDNVNNSTPLIAACEYLTDLECIKILVEGGADVNAVNNDDKMPLMIVKERLEKAPENEKIKSIDEYLKTRGA